MRLTSALVITTLSAAWGTIAGHPYLWLPYTGVAAAVVDYLTRSWVTSSRTGEAALVSSVLKVVLMLIGLYALLAQFGCVALGVYWIVRR
jgi:hypothetical protein